MNAHIYNSNLTSDSRRAMTAEASDSSLFLNDNKLHVLAASGSAAIINVPNIIFSLNTNPQLSTRLILTASAAKFLTGENGKQPFWKILAR